MRAMATMLDRLSHGLHRAVLFCALIAVLVLLGAAGW